MPKRLVLGIGNIHMENEGVSVHMIRCLAEKFEAHLRDTVFLDGGTGGFHLLEYSQTF